MRKDLHCTAFWQHLAPQLSLSSTCSISDPVTLSPTTYWALSNSIERDGYLQMPPLLGEVEIGPILEGIFALSNAGLPPVFIYMYDQPWALFDRLRPIIQPFLGDRFSLLPNFWAWHIPVKEGASGWPAHTDCSAKTRLDCSDGGTMLMSMSLWVPLTDATKENGCMVVLPRSREMLYDPAITDPAQINADDAIALPAKAGSVLGWSQDLYHWSAYVTANAKEPRISLSLEFQNPAFAQLAEPLLDIGRPPPFKDRLSLILRQFDKYQHMEHINFDVNQKISI